jgi:hypothetical protein
VAMGAAQDMEAVREDRWLLHVVFDPIDVQEQSNPEIAFPNDDASRFLMYLQQRWHEDLEDLEEHTTWNEEEVRTYSPVIDSFSEVLEWLIMHTLPKEIRLTRMEER